MRIIGETVLSHKNIEIIKDSIINETLTIAPDGSVKEGVSTHAYVFADSRNKHIIIKGAGPTDGKLPFLTSFRSELTGILATLLIVAICVKDDNISKGKISYFIDNRSAMEASFLSETTSAIFPLLQSDYDLIMTIHHIIDKLPITFTASHVKSHQKDKKKKLTFAEELNDIADHLATDFHHRPPTTLPPKTSSILLPNSRLGLIINDILITSNLPKHIRDIYAYVRMKSYLQNKYKWNNETFHNILWDNFYDAFKSIPKLTQLSVSKIINKWNHSSTKDKLYYGTCDKCKLCENLDTPIHFWFCKHKEMKHKKQQCMKKIWSCFQQLHMPQYLKREIDHYINNEKQPRIINEPDTDIEECINNLIHHQEKIGWEHLLYGKVTSHWKILVNKCNQTVSKPVITKFIFHILNEGNNLWRKRNELVHSKSEKSLESLKEQVRNILSKIELNNIQVSKKFGGTFHISDATIDSWNREQITKWIKEAEHSIKISKSDTLDTEKNMRTLMRKFLRQDSVHINNPARH